jgi:hypothetical protein
MPAKSLVDDEKDDTLRRPKVGADMPQGRPSWFHVPAPSQRPDSRYAAVKSSLQDLNLHTVRGGPVPQRGRVLERWNGDYNVAG